jgi:type I restriction enzyme S subunit
MSWSIVKIGAVLKQYRIEHRVQNDTMYKQVSILNDGSVVLRGEKIGKDIGRKRQFLIDVKKYPQTLIFTRQLLLQGSIGFANNEVHNCIVTENMPMFSVDTSKVDIDFFVLFIKSDVFRKQVRRIELNGSAQKSIHEKTFLQLEIPFPSLKEQREIIRTYSKFDSQNLVVRTEVKKQHDLIKQLRQAFIKDALHGKLVKQNAKEGNAIDLLEKIKSEKKKLIEQKKIRQGKIQEAELQNEILFDIPKNWVWCKLDEICWNITDGTHITPTYTTNGRVFLSAQNIKPFRFMPEHHKFVSEEAYQDYIRNRKAEKGDILVTRVGAGIGEAAIIDREIDFCFYVSLGLVQHFQKFVDSEYLTFVFNSPYGVQYAKGNISSKGGSAGNFNLGRIRSFLIPLPPLAEQKRIVKKLEDVMNLCEELKTTITDSQNYTNQLLQVALKDALQPKEKNELICLENHEN